MNAKFLIVPMAFVLTSCGTLFSSSSTLIKFDSDPQGVEVYNGAEKLGVTPFEYRFSNKTFGNVFLTAKKTGFEAKTIMLQKSLNTASLFNFLSITSFPSMVTSFAVDAATGGFIEYSPNSYMIILERAGKVAWAEYFLLNAQKIRLELSQGGGPYLEGLHQNVFGDSLEYQVFLNQLQKHRSKLLSTKTTPEMYHHFRSIL